MTKALCFCSVCFVLFTALAVNTAVSAPAINEFMPGPGSDWDGDFDSDSRDDEWVEITNTGAAALDLEGYYLLSGADRDPVFGFRAASPQANSPASTAATRFYGRGRTMPGRSG